MSVLLSNRGLSKMEFYHTAKALREETINFLLRDFGVKDKVRVEIVDGEKKISAIEGYPEWLLVYFRQNILAILHNMMSNITAGNTIYPVNENELTIRRQYQTEAIANCEQLIQEFQFCADTLPVKVEKFLPFIERLEKEILLLKGWRKSSNKLKMQKGGIRER
jgi:hypothetical protein